MEVPDDAGDRFAEAVCAAVERCGCLAEAFEDGGDCRQRLIDRFWTFERADWSGEFNEECFEKLLERIEDDDCDQANPSEEPPAAGPPCEVFPGTRPLGEACPTDWELGPPSGLTLGACKGQRSACHGGVCRGEPIRSASVGEPCGVEVGVRCDGDSVCDSGVCVPSADTGEACVSPGGCKNYEDYCDDVTLEQPGVCRQQVAAGEACEPTDFEPCEPLVVVSEDGNRVSSAPSYCSQDGICQRRWPSVCAEVALRPGAYWLPDWAP